MYLPNADLSPGKLSFPQNTEEVSISMSHFSDGCLDFPVMSFRDLRSMNILEPEEEPKVLTCILWFPIWCQCSVVFKMWPNHHLVKATCHLEMLLLVHFVKNLPTKKKDPYLECIVVHKPT